MQLTDQQIQNVVKKVVDEINQKMDVVYSKKYDKKLVKKHNNYKPTTRE